MTDQPSPYNRFRGQRLTLNDYLAIDRTILANERTLLSYGRTALAMGAVGASAVKFFEATWIVVTGVFFIIAAILVVGQGWRRYLHIRRRLAAALSQQTQTPDHPLGDDVQQGTP
jgi:putative membrane protein